MPQNTPSSEPTLAQLDVVMIRYSFTDCDGKPDIGFTWMYNNKVGSEEALNQVNYDIETNKDGTNGRLISIIR